MFVTALRRRATGVGVIEGAAAIRYGRTFAPPSGSSALGSAGVWFLKRSRGQYEREHTAAAQLEVNTDLARIVGAPAPMSECANVGLLEDFLRSVHVTSLNGGRSSERVYAGIDDFTATAESDTALKGAWVAISSKFVSMVELLSAVTLAFPHVLRQTAQVEQEGGEELALEMLGNVRGSAFQYLRMDGHEPDPELDAPELWEQFRQNPACVRLAQSAILWALCHELAHLTQGDCSSRTDRALREMRCELARQVPETFWPDTRALQDELIADSAAIDIAASSTHPAGQLRHLMPGSIVATTAVALDGWNLDRSALSDTHPSAFLRAECLSVYWCHYLERQREGQGVDDVIALEDFALAWGMAGWMAGRYREGRDRLSVFGDVNDMLGYSLAASGQHGVFLNSFMPRE